MKKTAEHNNHAPLTTGADVDILTGRPHEMIQRQTDEEEREREKTYLQNKMAFLDLSKSLDGRKLIELVQGHLARRIDQLVANDPQATAYIAILTDLGAKELQASEAAKKYFERYVKT